MQEGFIKAVLAIFIFCVGMIMLFSVVAYMFGAMKIAQSSEGNTYFILNLGQALQPTKCWIDMPSNETTRCTQSFDDNQNHPELKLKIE